MRHEEFETICKAVAAGEDKYLKHHITNEVGKVAACKRGDFFDVEIGEEHKDWASSNVEEEA